MSDVNGSVQFKASGTSERRCFTKVPDSVDPSAHCPYIACNMRALHCVFDGVLSHACYIRKFNYAPTFDIRQNWLTGSAKFAQYADAGLAFLSPAVRRDYPL